MLLEDEFSKTIKISSENENVKKYEEEANILRQKLSKEEEISKQLRH